MIVVWLKGKLRLNLKSLQQYYYRIEKDLSETVRELCGAECILLCHGITDGKGCQREEKSHALEKESIKREEK